MVEGYFSTKIEALHRACVLVNFPKLLSQTVQHGRLRSLC